jgi:hypothetical protein
MRKFFYWLGIAAASVIVLVVLFIAYTAYIGVGIDKEARLYADDAVIAITAHWDVKELRQRATPELLQQVKPEDLDSLFTWFATLGALVDYQGSKQRGWNQSTGTQGTMINAEYAGDGKYAAGSATIDLMLLKRDGEWRISGFHVNSSKLIENKVGRGT